MLDIKSIGGRPLNRVLAAPFSRTHYVAICNAFGIYTEPIDSLKRYLFNAGEYPHTVQVKSPMGILNLNTYTHHDMLTVSEIFCRKDYHADQRDVVVADFGSNIGISAAYFLSRSPRSHVYLFEPLPFNVDRLLANIKPFQGRFTLSQVAVGLSNGTAEFGWEESGRYGGIGKETGHNLIVECVDSNKILEGIVAKHGRIDVLKIDIETLEEPVTSRIPLEIATKINKVYVEFVFASNPLARTHRMRQYGSIAQFTNLTWKAPQDFA